jgi:hypothetical protein
MNNAKIFDLRHSRESGNPAILFNVQFGFAHAMRGNYFIDWIPACAGMTANEIR